jgi:hypothetical protein
LEAKPDDVIPNVPRLDDVVVHLLLLQGFNVHQRQPSFGTIPIRFQLSLMNAPPFQYKC